MKAIAPAVLAAGLTLIPGPALAHPPPFGIPGFFGGVLHPAFVPTHLMAVLALGILIGQQSRRREWAQIAFILALMAGLGVLTLGVAPAWTSEAVLLTALASSLLAALARPLPAVVGALLAAVAGFAIGLDSPPEVPSVREANLILIGTALGGTLLMLFIVEVAGRLTQPWQRVGARVLGSWIAASAVLVLVWLLTR